MAVAGEFSVIIPFYSEEGDLSAAFLALEKSYLTLPEDARSRIEVIVVNDASPSPPGKPAHMPVLHLLLTENRGVAFARNWGIRQARHEIFLCLDSDVVVGEDFFASVFRELAGGLRAKIVQGLIRDSGEGSLFSRYLGLVNIADARSYTGKRSLLSSGCFLSTKGFFAEIGYFNERFEKSGGEEFEILGRLPSNSIHLSEIVQVDHIYDGVTRRLAKVWRRSQHYASTAALNPHFPHRLKVIAFLRLFACAFFFTALALVSWRAQSGVVLAFLSLLLILFSDGGVYAKVFWRGSGVKLVLFSPFFLLMEYSVAGTGAFFYFLKERLPYAR